MIPQAVRTDVREISTSRGSMWVPNCSEHGDVIPVLTVEAAVEFAGVHMARMHGRRLIDVRVYARDGREIAS